MGLTSRLRCISLVPYSLKLNFFYRTFHCGNKMGLGSNQTFSVSLKPDTAYLRKQEDLNNFVLTMQLKCKALNSSKAVTICRSLDESLLHVTHKLNLKIFTVFDKVAKKKSKKGTVLSVPEVTSSLNHNGIELDDRLPSRAIFDLDGELTMKIWDDVYDIILNPPWIINLNLPQLIRSGTELFPVKFETYCTNKSDSSFLWLKSDEIVTNSMKPAESYGWIEVGKNYFYSVTNDDVGHILKFTCIPGNEKLKGPEFSIVSGNSVAPSVGNYHYRENHLLTTEKVGKDMFRIVSYNILADYYASTKEAKEMYSYCPKSALEICQRLPALCSEIIGYNADIICLQEVESSTYFGYLSVPLTERHFSGKYCQKLGVVEGVATFFDSRKFNFVSESQIFFRDELCNNPLFNFICARLSTAFFEKIKNLPHCVQLIVLTCSDDKDHFVIVGNLHLYSSPEADCIRLIQLVMTIVSIEQQIKSIEKNHSLAKISVLLCGDFNSTPVDTLHEYVLKGTVPSNHAIFKPDEIDTKSMYWSHSIKMDSAYGSPEFTTYTGVYKGCLDYIYYRKDYLDVVRVLPLPEEDILKKYVGLPSVCFPSDHVPLIADFKFKQN